MTDSFSLQPANWVMLVFLLCLMLSIGKQLWLARRQMRYVAAHSNALPADFQEKIPLAAHQKAADYTIAKLRFSLLELLLEVAILCFFTVAGGLNYCYLFWQKTLSSPLWQGVALIGTVALINMILGLPFAWLRQFRLEEKFGFNRMTQGLFWRDLVKQLALSVAIGVPLLLGVLWLMQEMGKNWWLYVWLFWSGFNVLLMWGYPTVIAPLFNKFTPLDNEATRQRIEALLQRCQFQAAGLMVMDGSKRSSHGNAYFTGFGRSRRIVFFDTLLQRLNVDEIEAVLAHELGHFKKKHIVQRIVVLFGFSFLLLWGLGQLVDMPWFFVGLGLKDGAPDGKLTAAALVLFFMTLPVFTFWLAPLSCFWSRRHEFQADQYAVAHSNGAALITALIKLYEDNATTLTPDPLYSQMYDSHPPATIRIGHIRQLMPAA